MSIKKTTIRTCKPKSITEEKKIKASSHKQSLRNTTYMCACNNDVVRTFFSFWISDATPTIPAKDFELVRWTLKTLQK